MKFYKSLIVSFLILYCLPYCTIYNTNLEQIPEPEPLPERIKIVILHTQQSDYILKDIEYNYNTISGQVIDEIPGNLSSISKKAHIYMDSTMVISQAADEIKIPISKIGKVEVYKKDMTKSLIVTAIAVSPVIIIVIKVFSEGIGGGGGGYMSFR